MNRRNFLRASASLSAALASASLFPATAFAKYPERPVRLIVPRTPGGVVDVIGREWAARVQNSVGTVVVENMGGGGGTIGAATAARAPADGHTLFLGSTSELVLVPILGKPNYDAAKDFTPISIMTVSVGAVVVHPSVPANNLKELVAYAKANPGKLNYGSAGTGSSSNLTGELFKHLAGLPDIVHIPYKGATPGLTDLVAGQVPIFTPMISGNIVELHNAGKVRILASASEQRMAASPNIPTAAEQGYPDLVSELFIGLFAPAGTPQPVIDQLVKATSDVTKEKEWQAKLVVAGFEPVSDSDPEKALKYLKAETARWTPVLKDSGLVMSQ
ncbi:MAG: tripartite tricarboxylate transporter substrate binding protein [Pseudomonadota bacterium]